MESVCRQHWIRQRRTVILLDLHFLMVVEKSSRSGVDFAKIFFPDGQAFVDVLSAMYSVPAIIRQLKGYEIDWVYNLDEFGLQYRLSPNSTIVSQLLRSVKKDKARITCLACCNASGPISLPFQFIGNARCSRAFNRQSGEDLGFDYQSNSKAWMNEDFFWRAPIVLHTYDTKKKRGGLTSW